MKTLAILAAIALTSCAVTTAPDGTQTTAPDPIAYHAVLVALEAYAHTHPVNRDK